MQLGGCGYKVSSKNKLSRRGRVGWKTGVVLKKRVGPKGEVGSKSGVGPKYRVG